MSARPIGTLGTIPTLTIGGRVFTDLTTLIRLYTNNSANSYGTFRKDFATSGYQITTGKTFGAAAGRIVVFSAGANALFTVAYGDDDKGLDSAVEPTTPKYPGGAATPGAQYSAASSGATSEFSLSELPIPALKYPFMKSTSSVAAMIVGYET